jgi:CDP-glycerol glycerophosphotransferase (TagB/SpsB family)
MFKSGMKNSVMYLIYILDVLLFRKKNIILFFQSNNKFDDNAKILFHYCLTNTDFEVYWLYEKNQIKQSNFIKRYSLKGFYIFLRAEICVISHGMNDMGLYSLNCKYIVQAWHGTPIKRIGMYDYKVKDIENIKKESLNYNMFIVASTLEKHYISSALGLNEKNFLISGLPRNDYLIHTNKATINHNFINKIKEKKVILYAPTFRDFGETLFFPFDDFNLECLMLYLKETYTLLLLRPHPNDSENIKKLTKLSLMSKGSILMAANNNIQDVNELLPFVDIIVTDYSSIYIDLLLKDIPPIFIPYDLEEYKTVRGLAYDYELVTPGPKVFTQKDFIKEIKEALNKAPSYQEKRKFVKRIFHKYDDGKACERIVDAIRGIK